MNKLIGILSLIFVSVASASAGPRAFPVPFIQKQHPRGISFRDLPASGTIKIVTVAGEEVASLIIPQNDGAYNEWPVTNSSGKPLASGVYYFFIDGSGLQTTGKLVIIR